MQKKKNVGIFDIKISSSVIKGTMKRGVACKERDTQKGRQRETERELAVKPSKKENSSAFFIQK